MMETASKTGTGIEDFREGIEIITDQDQDPQLDKIVPPTPNLHKMEKRKTRRKRRRPNLHLRLFPVNP